MTDIKVNKSTIFSSSERRVPYGSFVSMKLPVLITLQVDDELASPDLMLLVNFASKLLTQILLYLIIGY